MKTCIILQARLGSVRLPNKVIENINGNSLIEILLKRLEIAKNIDKIIVAIPDDENNIKLENHLNSLKSSFKIFKGSESDVLGRYYHAAKFHSVDNIVRITADCPLMDPKLIDRIIEKFLSIKCDFMSNRINFSHPDGMDVEVFKFETLKKTHDEAILPSEREHVTKYMLKSNKFKCINFSEKIIKFDYQISVDVKSDLNLVKKIFNHFHPDIYFSLEDILNSFNQIDKGC